MVFQEFAKIGRLTRECVITEKIDGTNAQVFTRERFSEICLEEVDPALVIAERDGLLMFAGSRTRYITPTADNFGFASWVKANADELWALGEGRHYGEWWGGKIQRGYGVVGKRFSLFNVHQWADDRDTLKFPVERPDCCGIVPVLYRGLFSDRVVDNMIAKLRAEGSMAAPGFMQPEGVVVFHTATGVLFKKTLDNDEQPKGQVK